MKKAIVPLCLIVTFALGLVIYINRFVNYSSIEVNGFAFNSNAIYNNLFDTESKEEITYENVSVTDTIYRSSSKYYVGEEHKKKITIDYPIVSDDASSMFIVSEKYDYITSDFDKQPSYKGTVLVGSKLYNTVNFEQATGETYYFMSLNNGIYTTVSELKIKTYNKEVTIPINSFVRFEKNAIYYYYMKGENFVYVNIPLVSLEDEAQVGTYNGTYKDLLTKIGIIKEDPPVKNETGNQTVVNATGQDNETAESEPEYIEKPEPITPKGYQKPEVSIVNTVAKTYSYLGLLKISDPSSAIIKMPTFEFYIGNSRYLTKTISGAGAFKITGLLPNTHYKVIAKYRYQNERGSIVEREITINDGKTTYEEFTTLGLDALNPIKIKISNVTTTENAFFINELSIKNDIEDEVLNGVKSIQILANDIPFKLTSSMQKLFINKNAFKYESAKTLESNTMYSANFLILDTAGNEIRTTGGEFIFKTKQAAPKAEISKTITKDFTKVPFKVDIINKDNVEILNITVKAFDENNQVIYINNTYDEDGYVLEGLDSAKPYSIKVYSSYKTDEGYVYEDVEIGKIDFISYDKDKLGKIAFSVKFNPESQTPLAEGYASLHLAYKSYSTQDPIYGMLAQNITVNIINTQTEEIEKTYEVNKNEFQHGAVLDIGTMDSESSEIPLKSDTEYRVEVVPIVVSGDKKIAIETTINGKEFKFKTLKATAYAKLDNIFIASGYIDFDVAIIDKDSAILESDKITPASVVTLNIKDKVGKVVYTKTVNISHTDNTEELLINRINVNKLEPDEVYDLDFKAGTYTTGQKIETSKLLEGSTSFVASGLNAKISIDEMIKYANYESKEVGYESNANLFEIGNSGRWKSEYASSKNTVETMRINLEENSISLGAYNGYRVYSYYLPELAQKRVTISFYGKRVDTISEDRDAEPAICIINGCSQTCTNTLNLTNEFKKQEFTYALNKDGYISFRVNEDDNKFMTTKLVMKDIKIEVGGEATEYVPYVDNGYVGSATASMQELISASSVNPHLNTNRKNYDYSISLVKDGEKVATQMIDNIDSSTDLTEVVKNTQVFTNIEEQEKYRFVVSARFEEDGVERYYDLDNIEFETNEEIRVIRNITEFFAMHRTGHYIAIDDLDFSSSSKTFDGTFNGVLDMQGHKIILAASKRKFLFKNLGGGATIKNADVHIKFDNESALSGFHGVAQNNYGTLSNIMITVDESNKIDNIDIYLMVLYNYGTINKFVIHNKARIYVVKSAALVCDRNYGIIKNGYAYGEPIDGTQPLTILDTDVKAIGGFVRSAKEGSLIENVYNTVGILLPDNGRDNEMAIGSMIRNSDGSTIRNSFVYESYSNVVTHRSLSKDIYASARSNVNYANNYYISDATYESTISKKQEASALSNVKFLDKTLNSDNAFKTAESWNLGIFPQLDMGEIMPPQDSVFLPTMNSTLGMRFLSIDKIVYSENMDEDYSANVTMSFYNPNEYQITSVNITDIGTVEKIGKESTNSDKITTVTFSLGNVKFFRSIYRLNSVKTGISTATLNKEIPLDLYRKIESLEDITDLSQNYMLTKDIDCDDEKCVSLGSVSGKINGNGHSIKNMKVTNCFIKSLTGTLENIKFYDFEVNKTTSKQGGIVCQVSGNGILDTVYGKNLKVMAEYRGGAVFIGGLVGDLSGGIVQNSGVDNVTSISREGGPMSESSVRLGGIAGYATKGLIDTCFARNVNFDVMSLSSNEAGMGGIVGYLNTAKIVSTYSTGNIKGNTQYIGGITGRIASEYGFIYEAISKVNIDSQQDYIAGIAGYTAANNNIVKTIALGNINTQKSDTEYIDRSSGTTIRINNNFVWDKQSINNLISKDTNGEVLLTQEELANKVVYRNKVGLGVHFELDENFRSGYIPMLKSSNEQILFGQGYYEEENATEEDLSDLEIYYKESFKLDNVTILEDQTEYMDGHLGDAYYVKAYTIELNIINEEHDKIVDFEIEDLNYTIVNDWAPGYEKIVLRVTPNKYFDYYKLTKITYSRNFESKSEKVNMIIDVPFYGQIHDVEDYKAIREGYYENYIIVANELDFGMNKLSPTTCNNIAYKSFAKLIGHSQSGNKTIIKNISCNFTKASQSFIDTITTDINNIEFQNINVQSERSGNYLGIIKFQNGYMRDVNFKNITVTGKNLEYVGIISINQAPELRNVNVETSDIKGKKYVGTIGRANILPITSVTIINTTVEASSDYAGGLYGFQVRTSKGLYTSYIYLDGVSVNTTGNYAGIAFGHGSGDQIIVNNGMVTSTGDNVGGIGGKSATSPVNNNYIFNSKIKGRNIVGGLYGFETWNIERSVAHNITVLGNENVGGVCGHGGYAIVYSAISNSYIKGLTNVGGFRGTANWGHVYQSYGKENVIEGRTNVGAIDGRIEGDRSTVWAVEVQATVIADDPSTPELYDGSNAGGLIGYLDNALTTSSQHIFEAHEILLTGITVYAKENAGGLIGKSDTPTYPGHFYNIYTESYVECSTESCGYAIGSSDNYSSSIKNFSVYENSLLTTPTKIAVRAKDAGARFNTTTEALLKTSDFYKNVLKIENWKFTFGLLNPSVTIYPPVESIETKSLGEVATDNLYAAPVRTKTYLLSRLNLNSTLQNTKISEYGRISLPSYRGIPNASNLPANAAFLSTGFHELPEAYVYVSDIDKFNIDFTDIDDMSYLIINGTEYEINQKTMTFNYDFNQDLSFKISDGKTTRAYDIKKEDLRNSILTLNDNYYYIENETLITNDDEILNNDYTNIFENKILLSNGNFYNIEEKKLFDNEIENFKLLIPKPLYESTYEGESIKTFYLYSLVNGEFYDGQLIVTNDELNVIDRSLNNKKDRLIIDNYNNKEYLLYLDINGRLHSLKDIINYPKELNNVNIKDINSNIGINTNLMFVLYKNGNYIVFNYKTGTLIASNKENKPNIFDYSLTYISDAFSGVDLGAPIPKSYKEAKSLVSKLKSNPIDEIISNDDSKITYASTYNIKYNPDKETYEVFELASKDYNKPAKNTKSLIVNGLTSSSMEDVISSDKALNSYYRLNVYVPANKLNRFIITVIISILSSVVIILSIMLGNIILKKLKVRG